MKQITTYITEKLHINKDTKIKVITPTNFDELKTFVEEYFWKWVENDEVFTIRGTASKEEMKSVYNHIMKSIEDKKYTFKKLVRWVLPLNFRKYMNKTYNLSIDEKL